MRGAGSAALFIGVISLAIGVVSRLMKQPLAGIEAHAIVQFAQTLFLLAIALGVTPSSRSS